VLHDPTIHDYVALVNPSSHVAGHAVACIHGRRNI
jgi:hypothetical protein